MFELKDTFSTSSFFFSVYHCVTFYLFPVHCKLYKTSLRCNLYLLSNVSNSLFNPLNVHYLSIDTNCGEVAICKDFNLMSKDTTIRGHNFLNTTNPERLDFRREDFLTNNIDLN